jgi:protein-tyrosine kinase
MDNFLPPAAAAAASADRSIGDIIRDARNLSAQEVERVLVYQREKGVRFGEAAVALGLASPDDVLKALAQQFHYPVASAERRDASPELFTLNHPFSPQAEAVRAVRTQVTMRWAKGAAPRGGLAVVSTANGDGKTFFAANLAVALAQLGGSTLLIDADLREPRQHDVFRVANSQGLSALLSGRADGQMIQAVDGVNGLHLLPAGVIPPNPLELLERSTFGLLVRELATKFDHVIVDTSAAANGADAAVAAAQCGAALVLARKNQSRAKALQELLATLQAGSVHVLGAVLNEH